MQGIYWAAKMFETWVQMTELLKHGRLNLEPLFKERMPLEKIRRRVFTSGIRPGREDPFLSQRFCEVTSSLLAANISGGIMTTTATRPQLQYLRDALEELKAKNQYFHLRVLEGEQKPVAIFDGKEVINLSSNNYLGLTTHPKLRRAAIDATRKYGVGSGQRW